MAKIKMVITRLGCKQEAMVFLEEIKVEDLPEEVRKELDKLASFKDNEEGTIVYFFQGTTFVERAKNLLFEFSQEKGLPFEVTE